MPRNGSGIMNLPAGNPVLSGTTISSAWANPTMQDFAAEITNSLPRDGQAPMTGILQVVNGVVNAPAIGFSSELATGPYRSGSHEYSIAVVGVRQLTVNDTGINATAIGATTPSTGKFTTLNTTGDATFATNVAVTGNLAITGTTTGITKAMVGLGNVDNTSDVNKPISTAVQAALDALVTARRSTVSVLPHNGTVPTGAFECNGQAVSRTTYAALFALIGTTWGVGDGSTTFNVPDYRGEFLRGFDNGRGVDTGRTFASAQSGQNASHTHGVTDGGHNHSHSDPGHAHGASSDAQGYHGHGVNDPGHSHGRGEFNGINLIGGSSGAYVRLNNGTPPVNTDVSGTGISIAGDGVHAHNISVAGAFTGLSNVAATTGVSIQSQGGTEARPRNVAVKYIIWW